MDRPGSTASRTRPGSSASETPAQRLHEFVRLQSALAGQVRDSGAAAEVDLVDGDAVPFGHQADEAGDPGCGRPESRGVENLRADVRVDSGQPQSGRAVHGQHCVFGEAARDRKAELDVVPAGGDVFVGVGGDAGGDPQVDVLHPARLTGEPPQSVDLLKAVDDHDADPVADCRCQFGGEFVVVVHHDPTGVEAGGFGEFEFAAAADVEVQPLGVDPAHHLRAQEGLGRVVHAVRARGAPGSGPRPEVRLVDHVQRGAAGLGERRQRNAPDPEFTGDGPGSERPDVRGAVGSRGRGKTVDGGRGADRCRPLRGG
jgi:hypothetical protein